MDPEVFIAEVEHRVSGEAHDAVNPVVPIASRSWPASPETPAFDGIPGEFISIVEPHSEADRAALLLQFLAAFGNAVGSGPFFRTEDDRQTANISVATVGDTGRGRKGTSLRRALAPLVRADETWGANCIAQGLSSGEGLIYAVRDPIEKLEPIREKNGEITEYRTVIADPGVSDKRLLITETEFASPLKAMQREGNTLSATFRSLWDSGYARTLTKNSPVRTTGAHVSLLAHITKPELLRTLSETDAANGFGNRLLWVSSRRSKCLPDGGQPDRAALDRLVDHVVLALEHGRQGSELARDAEATAIWREVYPALSAGHPGLLGALTGRAEAQVVRLSMVYALLSSSFVITASHLRSALAVWEFCQRSAAFIFGDALGDPVADTILDALRRAPDGVTRTEISGLFSRNREAARIDVALGALEAAGLAYCTSRATSGRPAQVWYAR
jgi:hypothetical protein